MSKLRTPVSVSDHQIGNPKAKVTLVEYGDYECPYCGEAFKLLKPLLKKHSNDLIFVFRNFPLQDMHPDAMPAALAAEAANDQGKFWEMHDLLYENQDALSDSNLVGYAEKLGLNIERFNTDRNKAATQSRVETDMESGLRTGVNGTPSFYINGNKLDSYDGTYESLANAVQSLE